MYNLLGNRYGFYCTVIALLLCSYVAQGQALQPGFDADEYLEVLQRCASQMNFALFPHTLKPPAYQKIYTSKEMGLHNRWEMWLSPQKTVMVINLRGTTGAPDNGVENLYAAMIPAAGTLKLSDTNTVTYKFAADPNATVHIGWTIGICSMIPDIVGKIREQYAQGIRQVLVEGHSQGGALAALLCAYLHYQVADGKLPADLVIKTYCSAAPKVGNVYFAYDFDYINRGGWAHTVINSADWVPQAPYTVQTFGDVNDMNPFKGVGRVLRRQNFFVRLYVGHIYHRIDRSGRKAQRRYEHYTGKTAYKFVKRYLPQFEHPAYVHNANYVSAGTPVILVPDDAYNKQFASAQPNIFMHHLFDRYYFLVKRIYKGETMN